MRATIASGGWVLLARGAVLLSQHGQVIVKADIFYVSADVQNRPPASRVK